jgi:hypothetical protein
MDDESQPDCKPSMPERPREALSLRHAIPALLLLCAGLVGSAAVSVVPRADAQVVAVVMRPGSSIVDAAALAERTDAALVRSGMLSNIWILASSRAGLARRLAAAGAWLVLDPVAGGGCLSFLTPNETDRKP